MRKFLILSFLFFSSLSLQAQGTYSGIFFTDYEEQSTLYLANNYNYQSFKELRITATTSKNIINVRKNTPYLSISDIDSVSGISGTQLHYLKQESHLIDWNTYTDDFGLTLHQTNFLYGLTGLLIGFVFLFASVQIIISEEYK